ncbi:MAG: hypothetical protein ACXVBE_00735 [Bdellovibrionota bacterium]
MRNHFFLLLVLASLFAFAQKFAGGESLLPPLLQRTPAQSEYMVTVEEIGADFQETNTE